MPYGAARIALVEQVIAHADAMHLDDLQFHARMVATGSYTHGGEPAKSFVTFSWCLAEYDRDPASYRNSTHTLLWHFKYMVSALRKVPGDPAQPHVRRARRYGTSLARRRPQHADHLRVPAFDRAAHR